MEQVINKGPHQSGGAAPSLAVRVWRNLYSLLVQVECGCGRKGGANFGQ